MHLTQFFVDGLGHASYLISSDETQEAAIVDPGRNLAVYFEAARQRDVRIRYVLETHVHNDFLSGARQLAAATGAEHVASAEAHLHFPYHPVRDGDALRLGELWIKVLFTPGHTPEHVSYVVIDTARAEVPVLAFTGGDLLVGSVGRPDLLGKEVGEKLAPLLYDSLHGKIMQLDDYVEVLPTHGVGSFCGRGISGKRTTTIGYERRFNPALQKKTKREFIDYVLSDNPGIPTYYRRMRPTNLAGPGPWQVPPPRPLPPSEVEHLAGHGAVVVDTRPCTAFGGAHLPRALNIGLGAMFATWVGWIVPADVPLLLVLTEDTQWDDVLTRLGRIGYENVLGYLQFGIDSWIESNRPIFHLPQWSVEELRQRLTGDHLQLLDVRLEDEWQAGHIDGAAHIPLGDLPRRVGELDKRLTTAVICGTGYRSSIGTSILEQNGFKDVVNTLGGMTAWYAATYPTTRAGTIVDEHAVAEQVRVQDEGVFFLRAKP